MDRTANAVVAAIPSEARFTAEDRRDTRILIQACRLAVTDAFNPDGVTGRIAVIRDHGPWLGPVRQAIRNAELPETDKAALLAAFNMATILLADLTRSRIRTVA